MNKTIYKINKNINLALKNKLNIINNKIRKKQIPR